MLLIPAIDLQKGRCVRLRQGDLENNITVYNEDAVDQACQWADLGAERIHIVDLDGAKTGKPVNAPLIREMIEEIGEDAEIEVGGGIRTEERIEKYLSLGVDRCILGSVPRRMGSTESNEKKVEKHGNHKSTRRRETRLR